MRGIDGAWRLLHIGVVNRLDDPGIAGIVLTAHDITARRDAEAAQQVSEGHLQPVICQLPIILFALEGTSRFTLSVGRSLDAIGVVPNQFVGLSVFELYRDEPNVVEMMRRALAGEAVSSTARIGGLVRDNCFTSSSRSRNRSSPRC